MGRPSAVLMFVRAAAITGGAAIAAASFGLQAQQASAGAVLQVQQSKEYGRHLTDADGRALYLFMADKGMKASACYDACARAWPPLLTKGTTKAGDPAVKSELIGEIERKDGSRQVTYNGWPLYYFVKDRGTGQTTGQDVKGFGAEWYLVSPQGDKVEKHGAGH